VLVSMTVAFFAALSAAAAGAAVVMPAAVVNGAAAFLPSNTATVVAVYASSRLVLWAYHFNRDMLQMYMGGI